MYHRKATKTSNLHIKITPAEKEALWQASDIYDTTISEIVRGWIHERLPVRPDPASKVRQMPLVGTHLSEVPPQQQKKSPPSAQRINCTGRSSDPSHECKTAPYLEYPQCRGCYIADKEHRQQTQLAHKKALSAKSAALNF